MRFFDANGSSERLMDVERVAVPPMAPEPIALRLAGGGSVYLTAEEVAAIVRTHSGGVTTKLRPEKHSEWPAWEAAKDEWVTRPIVGRLGHIEIDMPLAEANRRFVEKITGAFISHVSTEPVRDPDVVRREAREAAIERGRRTAIARARGYFVEQGDDYPWGPNA